MEYNKFIFVDYENVQDVNTDIIGNNVKMIIVGSENKNKIPIELIKKTQPFGEAIEWLKIESKGKKNALDFFIVYFLAFYTSTQSGKEYIIYSKDTGYDPLIDYLNKEKINVKRIDSFNKVNKTDIENKQIKKK